MQTYASKKKPSQEPAHLRPALGPSHLEHPLLDLQRAIGNQAVLRRLPATAGQAPLQRQPAGPASAPAPQQEIAEFEADRTRFEQEQKEHFESIGESLREHLLKAAGLAGGTNRSEEHTSEL